ncbi:tyrosine-type recombinase/integrase [Rhodococcus sp. BP22]|uniref:tyrosine-type recombinase/integrase n=1 Tax=Rhodococcus sp. BP22 TaxID=2758566 RepID=UPI0037CB47F5
MIPHELRHTAASLAIQSGANVKVVQRMLGHKSATLTFDLYGHLYADDLDSVADALDRAGREFVMPAADSLRTGSDGKSHLSESQNSDLDLDGAPSRTRTDT